MDVVEERERERKGKETRFRFSHTHELRVYAGAVPDVLVFGTGAIDHASGGSDAARACLSTGTAGWRLR